MTTIGDIFDVPDGVPQGDFVLRLTEGLQNDRRNQTLRQYVVTPQLVQCFDQAPSLIGGRRPATAPRVRICTAASAARQEPFHGGAGRRCWTRFCKATPTPVRSPSWPRSSANTTAGGRAEGFWWCRCHMIGAESMESAILGGYAAYIRQHHPHAPTPGFYRSDGLLAEASRLREQMGDERFFAALAGNGAGGSCGAVGYYSFRFKISDAAVTAHGGWDGIRQLKPALEPAGRYRIKFREMVPDDLLAESQFQLRFESEREGTYPRPHGAACL